jgi:hypothetical protein
MLLFKNVLRVKRKFSPIIPVQDVTTAEYPATKNKLSSGFCKASAFHVLSNHK